MFRTVPMMRLQAIVLAQDERAVLTGLGRLGAVHLTHMLSGPDTAPLAPIDRTGELARYDRIRARIQELRKSLEIPLLSKEPAEISSSHGERDREAPRAPLVEGATPPAGGQAQSLLIEERLRSLEERSADLLKHRQHLVQRQKELAGIFERVSRYRGLEIPLTGLDQFSFLHFVTGSLPAQNLEGLGKEVGDNVALLPLDQQKGQQSLFAITTRQGWPVLEKALQQAGFQHEILPVVEGATVDRLSEETEREQEQLAVELEQLNGRLKSMAAEFAIPLAEIEGFVDMEWQLLDASQKFPRTEATVLISGWVPAGEVAVVEQRMGDITSGRYVLQTSPRAPLQKKRSPSC